MYKINAQVEFYLASSLENAEEVQQLRDLLVAQGHRVTYDWTTHGSVQHQGLDACRLVAYHETNGVMEAKVVIAILPGGSGTHAELGMAIVSYEYGDKDQIILVAPKERYYWTPERGTCAFYHHPAVTWVEKTDDWQEWMEKVINLVNGDTEEEVN